MIVCRCSIWQFTFCVRISFHVCIQILLTSNNSNATSLCLLSRHFAGRYTFNSHSQTLGQAGMPVILCGRQCELDQWLI